MAVITSARRTYKDTNNITDSYCARIVRADGTVFRFTDAATDLTMTSTNDNGTIVALGAPVTYMSTDGIDLSSVGSTENQAGAVDLEGIITALGLSRDALVSGLFSKARIFIFLTNHTAPIEDEEKLFTGFWGETTLIDGRYVAKFNSLFDVLESDTTILYNLLCPVKLGSVRCGVQLAPSAWQASTAYTATLARDARIGSIVKPITQNFYWQRCTTAGTSGGSEPTWPTTVDSTTNDNTVVWTTQRAFVVDLTAVINTGQSGAVQSTVSLPSGFEDWFKNGFMKVTSGNNVNLTRRIVGNTLNTFTVDYKFREGMTSGSTMQLTVGCEKRQSEDCDTKFNNSRNHQGFKYMPGRKNIAKRGVQ